MFLLAKTNVLVAVCSSAVPPAPLTSLRPAMRHDGDETPAQLIQEKAMQMEAETEMEMELVMEIEMGM